MADKRSYRFGEFEVDIGQRVLMRGGKPVQLTPKVFDTLLILVENAGRIVDKDEMMRRLWPDTFVEDANLTFNILQIRKALGDNARQPQFIETVSRRGYRFIADVEALSVEGNGRVLSDPVQDDRNISSLAPETVATNQTDRPVDKSGSITKKPFRSISIKVLVLGLIALVAVAAVLAWTYVRRHETVPPTQTSDARIMLAVLPFQNLTGDAAQDYFSDGLTDEMITQLGNIDPQRLGVIARTSVMHYKNSSESLEDIGRELGVQYMVEGSVRRDSNMVRVTAQLVRVKDQSYLWSHQYDRELQNILAMQQEIGRDIADRIQLALENGTSPTPHAPLDAATYEAYDLCLKGQFFWNKRTIEGFQQAIEYYQRAIEKDPKYAPAYVGLADSYALLGGYSARPGSDYMQKARAAALRALELDERLAEAHTALALIVQNYDWDWETADQEFRRAIELNSNYATAHHWYAEHLMWRGRFDEALQESERARQLDPLSLIIAADRGSILYYARRYDESIAQFRAVIELDPDFARTEFIVYAYGQKGAYADAINTMKNVRPDSLNSPWHWSELAYIYGRMGDTLEAHRALENLSALDRRGEVDAATFVWAYLGVGDNEKALAALEKAYQQHSNMLASLKVEPALDPLRNDPRFQDILRRVKLDR